MNFNGHLIKTISESERQQHQPAAAPKSYTVLWFALSAWLRCVIVSAIVFGVHGDAISANKGSSTNVYAYTDAAAGGTPDAYADCLATCRHAAISRNS